MTEKRKSEGAPKMGFQLVELRMDGFHYKAKRYLRLRDIPNPRGAFIRLIAPIPHDLDVATVSVPDMEAITPKMGKKISECSPR